MIIAVDGPAASGKGTLAARLAAHYGLRHLDTGLLYRAVAHQVIANSQDPHDSVVCANVAANLDIEAIDPGVLRGAEIAQAASIVAVHPSVRAALLELQRRFAQMPPGAVLDGRDIGTVVCPDADVKLYVIATPKVRAKRRFLELSAKGSTLSEAEILADIEKRDARDSDRSVAPLTPADNAHLLDTSDFDIETAFRVAVDLVDRACKD